MDPYEVLGIRPNSGRDEIELAHKGRRGQYHPDRYPQSDVQIQAWAASKMQELNQVCAVLSNREERDRSDEGHVYRSSWLELPQAQPSSCPVRLGTLRRAVGEGGMPHRGSSPGRWTTTAKTFGRTTSWCRSSACSSVKPAGNPDQEGQMQSPPIAHRLGAGAIQVIHLTVKRPLEP
ncbi:J domain-containing protein [Pseudoxanthomonas mexicana]|uniref:J domain-containing protein n=1 Tax=Pseudoxanthomonas mexicana TaxID=128785 RepID=A0ABX6R7N1_PSEMX|nr:DnaJ domain-containing protein [Pseudoxanthomonas mexicana]QND79217.1 J domain-containing protein [Pseudoxanthomonas mexicana]